MSNDHLPDLAADRQADLAKRIGHLEQDAAAIPGMAEYYAGVARDFRQEQATLIGVEREAHGHDYAGSLGRIVAQHRAERGDTDTAALLEKEAAARFEIAGDLRVLDKDVAHNVAAREQAHAEPIEPEAEGRYVSTREWVADRQRFDAEHATAPRQNPEQGKHWLETAAENVRAMNAEATRQGQEPTPDPDKPRGKPSPDLPTEASGPGHYGALKSGHDSAQALIEDEQKRKVSGPAADGVDFREFNVPTVAASQNSYNVDVGIGPGGMTTTITNRTQQRLTDAFDSEQAEPHRPGEPKPMHPDDHAAAVFAGDVAEIANSRIVQGEAPAERQIIGTISERMAAELAEVRADIAANQNDPAARQMQDESSRRQEAELKSAAGEGDALTPRSVSERLAADLAEVRAEITERNASPDTGRVASTGRGAF